MRRFLVSSVVSFLLSPLLLAQSATVLAGDYIEGRSNHVFGCYCEWSGESQTSGHEVVVAWAIRKGAHRGVPLEGIRMAAVIVGESTLSQGAPPRKSVLVVDSQAAPEQRKAAEALLRERFRNLIGQVLDVYTHPVRLEVAPESATLKVGDLLNVNLRKARIPEDVLQGSRLWYDPFIPLVEPIYAVTLNTKYGGRDFGSTWNRSEDGVTGYFGRFELKLE